MQAHAAIERRLDGASCRTQAAAVLEEAERRPWELAYALAWLSVAGGYSVMPPWVRHQFPGAGRLLRRLRNATCASDDCQWCRERHDAGRELTRWFGFDDSRSEPAWEDGRPLQEVVVQAAMAGTRWLL